MLPRGPASRLSLPWRRELVAWKVITLEVVPTDEVFVAALLHKGAVAASRVQTWHCTLRQFPAAPSMISGWHQCS